MDIEKKIKELEETIELMKTQLDTVCKQCQDLEVNVYHLLKGIIDDVEEKAGNCQSIAPTKAESEK